MKTCENCRSKPICAISESVFDDLDYGYWNKSNFWKEIYEAMAEHCTLYQYQFERPVKVVKNLEKEEATMSKASVPKMEVRITEQTLREIVKAVDDANQVKHESIRVESEYSKVAFIVDLEVKPHTQESLGYRRKEI